MHRADLSEHVIAVERELIPHADVALKGRRPGERAAQCPARIGDFLSACALQRAKVYRCSVRPQKCHLLDQLAVIPGGTGLDGEPGRDAGHAGGFNAAHPLVTTVEGYAEADDLVGTYNNLCVV